LRLSLRGSSGGPRSRVRRLLGDRPGLFSGAFGRFGFFEFGALGARLLLQSWKQASLSFGRILVLLRRPPHDSLAAVTALRCYCLWIRIGNRAHLIRLGGTYDVPCRRL